MFGLSIKEVLVKSIKNACINEIKVYREQVSDILNENLNETEVSESRYLQAKRDYFNAVFDAMWASFRISAPTVEARIRLALMEPSLTGLPVEFTVDYLGDNGISAGATFAICYYAISNRKINLFKDSKTLSMLNHFQNDIMNHVLEEFEGRE